MSPSRRKPGENRVCQAVVTPVPNFLFSEQKLKMLPEGGACAMFFTTTIPRCCRTYIEPGSHQVIARHDF
jgi:hypothetical protein